MLTIKHLFLYVLLCTASAYSMDNAPVPADNTQTPVTLTPEQEAKLLAQKAIIDAQLPEIERAVAQAEQLLEESKPAIQAAIIKANYTIVDQDMQNKSLFGSFAEKLLFPIFSEATYTQETLTELEHIFTNQLSRTPEGSPEHTKIQAQLAALREMSTIQGNQSCPTDYHQYGYNKIDDTWCKNATQQLATLQQELQNNDWRYDRLEKQQRINYLQSKIDDYQAYKKVLAQREKLESEHHFFQENFNFNFGIYGEDLINAGLLAGHALNDYLLFCKLKRYANEQILKTILLYKNELLTLLRNVNRNIDGSIVDDENITALYTFFSLNCFNTQINTFLSNYKTLGIALNYVAFKELLAGLERTCIDSEKTAVNLFKNYFSSNLDLALHSNDDADEQAIFEYAATQHERAFKKYWQNWSVSSLAKPLITIKAGKEAILAAYMPTIRSCALSISGTPSWYTNAINTYAFHLLKSTILTTYFIKQIDAHYNKNWQHFLFANIDLLTAFITPLVNDATNKELATKHQAALEQFINERATTSFVAWWQFKSKHIARAELVIEALLLTPAWIKLIKLSPQRYEWASQ